MKVGVFVVTILGLCLLMFSVTAQAAIDPGFSEGMSQGDFAKLLIKTLHAEGLLPPAATLNDVFKFWEDIGIVPPGGWNADAAINKEDLIAMLGPKAEGLSFEELIERLIEKLSAIIDAKTMATEGAAASVSPVAPKF